MIGMSCCGLGCVVTLQLAVEVLLYWLERLVSLPDVPHSFTTNVLGFSMWHVVHFQLEQNGARGGSESI